jgi:hypothetical protein
LDGFDDFEHIVYAHFPIHTLHGQLPP